MHKSGALSNKKDPCRFVTCLQRTKTEIKQHLRKQCSPRHTPDYIIPVKEIPYTISGKKMEIPVKKIFLGLPLEKVAASGAMRNPESLNAFVEIKNKMNF